MMYGFQKSIPEKSVIEPERLQNPAGSSGGKPGRRPWRASAMILVGISLLLPVIASAQKVIEGIVAVVGDSPIAFSEVEERVGLMVLQGIITEEQQGDPEVKKGIVEEMIREKLLIAYAMREGFEVFQDELNRMIEDQVEAVKSSFPNGDVFNEELAKQGISLPELKERYKKIMREKILQEKVLEREIRSRVDVSEREMRDYYENHRKELPPSMERLHYKSILIPVRADQETRDKIKDELGRVRLSIEAGTVSFREAAAVYSDDTGTKAAGGDLGIGVAVRESTSMFFFISLIFSLCLTPNLCSSSITRSPRSLNETSF